MGSTIALAEAAELEPTFLPEGWEIKVAGSAEDIDSPAPAAQLISSDEATGEVVAIVGVTGIVDHVGDLIEVGAYGDTLTKRRPKVCWAHDWEQPIGKVPAIEEWAPGDPRFQQVKATLDGKPWPSSAGALVARMQFNMKSERGREAFAAVEFYSETGECEWSIGWQTVPGQTVKRKDGVRVCKKVELYEVSPVLFGAAPHTRTLQLKALDLESAQWSAIERKSLHQGAPGTDDVETPDEKEKRLHRLGMPEVDWSEVQAHAGSIADGGGNLVLPSTPVSTVTNSGTDAPKSFTVDLSAFDLAGDIDLDALAAQLEAKDDHPGDRGQGDGKGNKGNASSLIKWYTHGEGAAKIRWGTDGDFMRCVHIAEKHMTPENAKGFCALRHRDTTGATPGHAPLELAEHAAKKEGKSAGLQAAEMLAKSWNPLLEVGRDAAHVERKMMSDAAELTGTFEERQRALQEALDQSLRALNAPAGLDDGELGDDDDDGPGPTKIDGWVTIDGTWDDRVVATYVQYGPGPTVRQTYQVPYTWDGEDIDLGTPAPVQLQVSVVPIDDDGDYDGDGPGEGDDEDDVSDALVAPVLSVLGNGVTSLKALAARAPEIKQGMVLSGANSARLKTAIEHLVQVAKAAGIDLSGLLPDPAPMAGEPGVMPDTTAPGTPAMAGVKVLSAAQIQADLGDLENFL